MQYYMPRNLRRGDRLMQVGGPATDVHVSLPTLPPGVQLTFFRTIGSFFHTPSPLDLPTARVLLDQLHVLDAGVCQVVAGRIFQKVLLCDALQTGARSKRLRLLRGLAQIQLRYAAWCEEHANSRLVQTAKLASVGMSNLLGDTAGQGATVKAKALESRLLFRFARDLVQGLLQGALAGDQVAHTLGSVAEKLHAWYEITARNGPRIPPDQAALALQCARNGASLFATSWAPTPKFHFWVHMSAQMCETGLNPRIHALDVDETMNAVVARAAARCHPRTWTDTSLIKLCLLRETQSRPW